jgi:hypothetical protein
MEEIFLNIFIFAVVLVFYLHVLRHTKQSNDLEIYEIEDISKEPIDDIFDCLQPALFEMDLLKIDLSTYTAFDVNLRKENEELDEKKSTSMLLLPMRLDNATKVLSSSAYFSEKNHDFIQDTGLIKQFQKTFDPLRPDMTCTVLYDLLFGSARCTTPLQYHLNYRQFFMVSHGEISLRLSPPKTAKHIITTFDYENFEFRSTTLDPWSVDENNKVQFMDIKMTKGKTIYIPAYWWYSIRFETADTILTSVAYRTFMNTVSILPHLFISVLQKNNVKTILSKKLPIPSTSSPPSS